MQAINWKNVKSARDSVKESAHNSPVDALRLVAREPYAWPGGYPMAIITEDGGLLCADCVRKEYRIIYRDAIDGSRGTGWVPAAYTYATGHADGDPVEDYETSCDNCNANLGELCR